MLGTLKMSSVPIDRSMSLPVELWLKIIECMDIPNLVNLRASSRRLCAISTPILFHQVAFQDNKNDLQRLREVLRTPVISGLAQIVKLTILGGRDQDGGDRWIRGGWLRNFSPKPLLIWYSVTGFASGLRRIPIVSLFFGVWPQFKNLRTLEIKIACNAGKAVHSSPLRGQVALINSIMDAPSLLPLNTLILSGLAVFPGLSLWNESVVTTLKSLISLELRFGTEGSNGHGLRTEDNLRYVNDTRLLSSPDLKQHEWELTHLTLGTKFESFLYKPFGFATETFPKLEFLHIKGMVFRIPPSHLSPLHPSPLEEFIIRHCHLRTLHLERCEIQIKSGVEPYRNWATVCDSIARILLNLVQLSISRANFNRPNQANTEWPLGYSSIKLGQFYGLRFHDPSAVVRDDTAIQNFERSVKHRPVASGLIRKL